MTQAISSQRTLGLVAGLGVGASMYYYKALVDGHLVRGRSPRILMAHADVGRVSRYVAAREARELAEYLADLLRQLRAGGAHIATIPAITPHMCAAQLADITPLPLIGLADAIAAEVRRRACRRVALFGSRLTIESHLFGTLHGVTVVDPSFDEIETVVRIYNRVVDEARCSTEDYERLRELAHTLVERESLDAIILAGTDLALVFDSDNADFPHVDCARVHIERILHEIA